MQISQRISVCSQCYLVFQILNSKFFLEILPPPYIRIDCRLMIPEVMQQMSNRSGKWLSSNQYETLLLVAGLAFAFALDRYVILLFFAVQIVRKLMQDHKSKRLERIESALNGSNWLMYHQSMRDALEFLKCARMIQKGYSSKSNTNIILQEEKEGEESLDQNEETDIAKVICQIASNLVLIRQFKRRLEDHHEVDEAIPFAELRKFEHIFAMSRLMDSIFVELVHLSDLFKARISSPLMELQASHLLEECEKQLIPLLASTKSQFEALSQSYHNEMDKLQLIGEFRQAYNQTIAQERENYCIQALLTLIDQCQSVMPVKNSSQIIENNEHQFLYDEVTTSHSNLQSQPTPLLQRPNPIDKKQFMRKLDVLLLMGLAKRKQEQFQKKLRQQQQREQA